jgi:primosomal protein N' (replication factor Y) (superfamily II helicase)
MAEIDSEFILSVAIPRPIDGLFTYRLPKNLRDQVQLGSCVTVPFGHTTTHAFVVEAPRPITEIPKGLSVDKLKSVLDVNQEGVFLTSDVLELCRWAHEYYRAPLGEILHCAVPASALSKMGKVRKKKEIPSSLLSLSSPLLTFELTSSQKIALEALEKIRIGSPLTQGFPKASLLHGVTGSGKTELYLELARRTLTEGKNVLVLVPEIALTPQLHQRFEKGLGMKVGLWHSAMAEGKRKDQAQALRWGTLRVLIGARSAVFAPIQNLGFIVIDEEHDPSYKQQDRVRYHARDLAMVRAKITGAFIVLGSATPSLEARERVLDQCIGLATLPQRAGSSQMPEIDIVNLCLEEKEPTLQAPFAHRTLDAIRQTIADGNQAMIFLNRRGFASFLMCKDCGEVPGCKNCSISLTVHRRSGRLRCHVCTYEISIPLACSKCSGTQMNAVGAGTESLEEELPALIAGAKPLRLDRDQVTSATRLNTILTSFREGHANLLLGTQMLVKGHDFPNVTLVVVVLADALFRWPDFRAPERAYQILTQVSGRAGRGEKPGKVLIQAYDVLNPVLCTVKGTQSEKDFLEGERQLRKALFYPPFGRLARIRFENKSNETAEKHSKFVASALEPLLKSGKLSLLGPSEAFLEKAKGIWRWDLLLKAKEISSLQQSISLVQQTVARNKWQSLVDIDPLGV